MNITIDIFTTETQCWMELNLAEKQDGELNQKLELRVILETCKLDYKAVSQIHIIEDW